jgi:hypothetical protein
MPDLTSIRRSLGHATIATDIGHNVPDAVTIITEFIHSSHDLLRFLNDHPE